MNSQDVSLLVAQEVQQLNHSLVDELSRQLRHIRVGRDAADPIPRDRESNASDTDMDGPDGSLYLTGFEQITASDAVQALSDLLGRPPALTFIQQTETELPLYAGVSPLPRTELRRSTDEQLNAVQRELEPTVYLIVNTVVQRTQQLEYLHTTTAFVRSTFEDIQQR